MNPQLSTFRTFQVPKLHEIEPKIFVKRTELPAAVFASEADTLGWDTVNSIRLPVVNASLSKSNLYPKAFNEEINPNWKIDGKFKAWKIVRGGSGAILFMQIPISEGHMDFIGINKLDFTEGYATVSIKLQYLPQPPAAPETIVPGSNGKPQYLVSNSVARSADDPAVVIQNMNYGSVKPSVEQDALFRSAVATWFNKNLHSFTYVFTTVNINALAAEKAFQWLKPTYTSYAYFNGPTDETSYFGVLNMTSGDSPEGLSNQLPPSSVPEGCNSSLLISNKRFLSNMVLPGFTTAFPKATQNNFTLCGNNTLIKKVGDDVEMNPIRVNGLNYTPYLQKLTYQIVGDEMQINTQTKVNISLGIDAYIISTGYYKIKLVTKPDGGHTLDFEESRTGEVNSWNEVALGVQLTVGLIAILTACTAGVAKMLFQETFKRVIAYVIIAIVAGIIAAIPTLIAEVIEGKAADVLPSIGDMIADATGEIQWPDSSGFVPSKVEMNGSLQIGGTLS